MHCAAHIDDFDAFATCPSCGFSDIYNFAFCTCCPNHEPMTECACGREFTYERQEEVV